ncbi:MAG: tetratricopeptide repeat protein, partial [Gammaproteobacteria bacterium]|nr:tetratricopeptide repeat protein [Gammaproteobacteria bacterium]
DKLESAISYYNEILAIQPDSVLVASKLAGLYVRTREQSKAKAYFSRLAGEHADNVKVLLACAQAMSVLKENQDALDMLNSALKLSSKNLEVLRAKVVILGRIQDPKSAVDTLQIIKREYPDDWVAFYQMGKFYHPSKKYDKAIAEYREAIKVSPQAFDSAFSGIIQVYVAQNNKDKALREIQSTLKTKPESELLYNLLGEMYVAEQDYKRAGQAFEKAIEINPGWTIPLGNLANMYINRGEVDKAVHFFEKAITKAPRDVSLRFSLAIAYMRSGDSEKSINEYQKILDMNSDNRRVVDASANNLASILANKKANGKDSMDRAVALVERFVGSENSDFLDTLGWVYLKAGRKDEGLKNLEKAISINPKRMVYYYHLGIAYYGMGNHDLARENLVKAVDSGDKFKGYEHAKTILGKLK